MKSNVCLQMALNPDVSVYTQLTDKLYIEYIFSGTVYKYSSTNNCEVCCLSQMALNPAVSVCIQITDNLYIEYIFSVTVYK